MDAAYDRIRAFAIELMRRSKLLRETLETQPEVIAGVERQILTVRETIGPVQEAARDREDTITTSVALAVKTDDKPLYPNDVARKAEVRQRLSTDDIYQRARKREQELQTEKSSLDITLRLEQAKLESMGKAAHLLGDELRMTSAVMSAMTAAAVNAV